MSSFNDSGGEDGGDICNIFDFDEDDDVVGRMQSEWDEDTSTTTKKRKFKAFLTDGDLSAHFSDKLKAIACCPRKDCSCLSMLRDPDMCSALVSYLVLFERKSNYEQDSIILQWVFIGSISPVLTAGGWMVIMCHLMVLALMEMSG